MVSSTSFSFLIVSSKTNGQSSSSRGHASENPRLPESLAASQHKIIFIGPPGSAMRSLGDKISSTIVAQSAQVPCMAWSGTGITDTEISEQGFVVVPDGPYQDACVKTVEDGLVRAEKIGLPVMIKASEGGGGKGIRMVHSMDTFRNSYTAVASEVPGTVLSSPSCPKSLFPYPLFFHQDLRFSSWPSLDPLDIWRSSFLPISTETLSLSLVEIALFSDDIRRLSRRLQ